jgi:hypothetical protein
MFMPRGILFVSDFQTNFSKSRGRSASRKPLKRKSERSESRVRSTSRPPRDQSGVRDEPVGIRDLHPEEIGASCSLPHHCAQSYVITTPSFHHFSAGKFL